MANKFFKYGFPSAVAILGSSWVYKEEFIAFADSLKIELPKNEGLEVSLKTHKVTHDYWHRHNVITHQEYPRQLWDHNWDRRDPKSLVGPRFDEETHKIMLKTHTPAAVRNIFLIRHGQYENKHGSLSDLGIEQARLLGQRLAKTGRKFDYCVSSTMPRAKETAEFMLKEIDPEMEIKHDPVIEELAPYPNEPFIPIVAHVKEDYIEGHQRIEEAFKKYFHRASPDQNQDTNELIVCHGNVIRYLMVKALQLPPESWSRFFIANASFVWLVIYPNGYVVVKSYGDMGHLPDEKVSWLQKEIDVKKVEKFIGTANL